MTDIRSSLQNIYEQNYRAAPRIKTAALSEGVLAKSFSAQPPVQQAQGWLRDMYNKSGIPDYSIGDHPDFLHLRHTNNIEKCAVTTLFMDLEGSTRLNLFYTLEEVYFIKNAFIRGAIEIIKSFDGHVHRIMGDAVMAFFGGKNRIQEDSLVDAVNCGAVLRLYADSVINKQLKGQGLDGEFGIRIGIDHGTNENVLWSSYGYFGMEEVTATSFFVDIASKLQHQAGRNGIMIGQSLRNFMDFPEELLRVKTFQKDGQEEKEPFITPNYRNKDGNPINYTKHLLRVDDYLQYSPLFQHDGPRLLMTDQAKVIPMIPVTADLYSSDKTIHLGPYAPSSATIAKETQVKFRVHMPVMPRLPYTVNFTVENHGTEAAIEADKKPGGEKNGNHSTAREITTAQQHQCIEHWEHAGYRGLHYMTVEVVTAGKKLYRTTFGVYVR